jgi:hypothetical protein
MTFKEFMEKLEKLKDKINPDTVVMTCYEDVFRPAVVTGFCVNNDDTLDIVIKEDA